MKNKLAPYLFAVGSFLSAWQSSDYSLEFKAVMGAVTCAVLGYGSPKVLGKK